MFSYRFDILIKKILLKNKKKYFNIFTNKKPFKKYLLSFFQTPS
jgi:hypothetical protein